MATKQAKFAENDRIVKAKRENKRTPEEIKRQKRARAKARRLAKRTAEILPDAYKPIAEWDNEELARGRPRAVDGTFAGIGPKWMGPQVMEEAIKRFKELAGAEMRVVSRSSVDLIKKLIECDDKDRRGRPLVPWSVRLDAAKFAWEVVHGKPTQRQEIDMSVKLQGILGTAMVQPGPAGELEPAIMDVPSWEDEDEDEDEENDELAG